MLGRFVTRLLTRSPRIVAWKVWDRARKKARRYRRQSADAPLPRRAVTAALETDLGSRFFVSSADVDSIISSLSARDPKWREAIIAAAGRVLDGEVEILGAGPVQTGHSIDWSRDYRSGLSFPAGRYAFDYDFLDFGRPSDVRITWELNRLQFLIPLGIAYRLTRDEKFVNGFISRFEEWATQNPMNRSVNWTVAMEVGIRALTLLWLAAFFLPSAAFRERTLNRLLRQVFAHARFVRDNIEYGDLRNNHYLSNLVALLVCGFFFRETAQGRSWMRYARPRLAKDLMLQIHPDGSGYEGSIPYHQLVAEIYLASMIIMERTGPVDAAFRSRVEAMVDFVMAYTKPDGRCPQIGDTDDGRLLPLGLQRPDDHRHVLSTAALMFGRGDFKAAAERLWDDSVWLLGPDAFHTFDALEAVPAREPELRAFPAGGYFFLRAGDTHVAIDCADAGLHGRGAHGHNDVLSFELVWRGADLIVDTGTSSYTGDRGERRRVLSTAAHNCPFVDGQESAPVDDWGFVIAHSTPFRALEWSAGEVLSFRGEHYGYRQGEQALTVRRELRLDPRTHELAIIDELDGIGSHSVDFNFHFHPDCAVQLDEEGVVVRSGGREVRVTAALPGGQWSVQPTHVYLRYARAREARRATFTARIAAPASVRFLIHGHT